ncbi:MAG: hypothetical protein LBD99_02660 [Candidatus Margulisbacteria bacterium]|jgi:hypothetical protein|nr:hypothetical protein [Candidatus Margulisiibacteriota bacterium]
MLLYLAKNIYFTDPHKAAPLNAVLNDYAAFLPYVDQLKTEISRIKPNRHPAFLAAGRTVRVFGLELDSGKYAVRLIYADDGWHHFYSRLCGYSLNAGRDGMEQIVAASLEDGVTISRLMPGRLISWLSAKDAACISPGQLAALLNNLIQAYQNGILIDTSPGNLFYDRDAGFGIIDYCSVNGLSYALGNLAAAVLAGFGFKHRIDDRRGSPAVLREIGIFYRHKISLIEFYKRFAAEKFAPEDYAAVEETALNMLRKLRRLAARRYGIVL